MFQGALDISKMTPKDKSRPISSTPVPGTPWCVVWTGDHRSFFYNPTNKQSVWEKPAEMVGRSDVAKMLESPTSAEEFKKKQASKTLPVMEEPASKRQKVIADDQPVVMMMGNEEAMIIKDGTQKKLPAGKEAAIKAEVRAARERAMVPLKNKMIQCRSRPRSRRGKTTSSCYARKRRGIDLHIKLDESVECRYSEAEVACYLQFARMFKPKLTARLRSCWWSSTSTCGRGAAAAWPSPAGGSLSRSWNPCCSSARPLPGSIAVRR